MDGRPPLTHGFYQGIFCYKAKTFLNPTNTDGAVNDKWNILLSFLSCVLESQFFRGNTESQTSINIFFKKI